MSLSVVNPALLTVIDIFFGCPVSLTDVVELSNGFFFLVFIEKGGLEGCEECCLGRPGIRSISLFDHRFDIVLLPLLSFSFAHVREDKDDLLFVSREVSVGTSFEE